MKKLVQKTRGRALIGSITIVLLIAGLICIQQVSFPPTAKAFGVEPMLLKLEMKRGKSKIVTFKVWGDSPKSEHVESYISKYFPKRDGSYDLTPIAEGDLDPMTDVQIDILDNDIKDFSIKPGEEKYFRLRIKVPTKAENNEYIYSLVMQPKGKGTKKSVGKGAVINFKMRFAVMVVVNIAGRPDKYTAEVQSSTFENNDKGLFLNTTVANTGNRYLHLGGTCKIYNSSGQRVSTFPLVPPSPQRPDEEGSVTVFPDRLRDVKTKITKALEAGEYRAEVSYFVTENKRNRLKSTVPIIIAEDYSGDGEQIEEDVATLSIDTKEIVVELGQKRVKTKKIAVKNNTEETIELALGWDEKYLKTSKLPIRLKPGKHRSISVRVSNPDGEQFESKIDIVCKETGETFTVPVKVYLPAK